MNKYETELEKQNQQLRDMLEAAQIEAEIAEKEKLKAYEVRDKYEEHLEYHKKLEKLSLLEKLPLVPVVLIILTLLWNIFS